MEIVNFTRTMYSLSVYIIIICCIAGRLNSTLRLRQIIYNILYPSPPAIVLFISKRIFQVGKSNVFIMQMNSKYKQELEFHLHDTNLLRLNYTSSHESLSSFYKYNKISHAPIEYVVFKIFI